ncbi:DedA family protein [Streptomyces tuirus]|uniref:DedA family protein n=1 Tax=Streptomyces tuirus TaxID=68278 RepID=A0A941FCP1_9ACTN|nr:DedA family protein [Streptomyces tuirus]
MDAHALMLSADHVAGWGYLLLFAVTATPLMPNGSLVMASAALAGQGHMSAALVVLAVLSGTLSGDLLLYGFIRWTRRRLPRHPARPASRGLRGRFLRLLRRAEANVHRNGTAVLVTMRFIPGGRATGATAAGLGSYPATRYAAAAILAETSWTALYVTVGYTGGKAAPGPLLAVAAAVVMGSVMSLIGLFLRRCHRTDKAVVLELDEPEGQVGSAKAEPAIELVGRL